MPLRVATDIGGTFTDLVFVDEDTGTIGLAKVPSTPGSFERGIMDAISEAAFATAEVRHLVHGTTVVINAITERRGAKTALLTTRGMRDVLEIARGNRPDIYNLRYRKPEPFVPRSLRLDVRERIDAKGVVAEDLDERQVEDLAVQLREQGVEAVAVCFLHSYANPDHERRAGHALRKIMPHVFVSLSHQVSGQFREYERTNTTVLNSYVGPSAGQYLRRLESQLGEAGIGAAPMIVHSNGGMSTIERTRQLPINLLESGPAAGVVGAAALGLHLGFRELITLDVGGTTAKTSLIDRGQVRITTEHHLEKTSVWAGYPIQAPVVDILEIGAGGGSIAWLDADGAVKVGPRSAGALPGPAAYGHPDGVNPTLTDANLLAGRLNPDYFLGGAMKLHAERSRDAYSVLGQQLGLSYEETARGVIRIAGANMVNAIKIISVQRGHDPRDFALFAMGGGGALHAPFIARELRIGTVVIPVAPGHFSAFGMLTTDIRRDYIRTFVVRLDRPQAREIEPVFEQLEEEARAEYADDSLVCDLRFSREADMRYRGQEHTVHVTAPEGRLDDALLGVLEARFHEEHRRLYSFELESAVELVNVHVVARGIVAKPPRRALPTESGAGAPLPESVVKRAVWFEDDGEIETPVYRRADLTPGAITRGPALIEESASVTVAYPEMSVNVNEFGELLVETNA